jgi:hypothetical protein
MRLTPLFVAVHIGTGAMGVTQQAQSASRWSDRVGVLVTTHLGGSVTACARFRYQFIRGSTPTALELEALQTCMASAFEGDRVFYFSIEGTAVDSYVATGLMRTRSGQLQRFWYDSAPCGGPGCPERFQFAACQAPGDLARIDPFMECSKESRGSPTKS